MDSAEQQVRFVKFQIWTETGEESFLWIKLADISSIEEYRSRPVYGQPKDLSEIRLHNGSSYTVHGHASNVLQQIMENT